MRTRKFGLSPSLNNNLRKVLRPIHLWAITVGLVISGEYFGWNNGWAVAGTVGMLITTLVVALMFVGVVLSYAELTSAMPQAGGSFIFAMHSMGTFAGLIAGYAILVDFLFAVPAIGFSLGSYINFLYPGVPVVGAAIGLIVIFVIINLIGIRESALFALLITVLAVGELLLYMGIIAPKFKTANFLAHTSHLGYAGMFAAVPFAVWFFGGIEGAPTVAEEVKAPNRNFPKGYIAGLLTVVPLALAVMVLTGGVTDWRKLSQLDYPLPATIGMILGNRNYLTKIFTGIGLFGLIVNLHSMILASSRQVFAMSRSGFAPKFLAAISQRFKTPRNALVFCGLFGIAIVLLSIPFQHLTDKIIIMSVLGALLTYVLSILSLFFIRRSQPNLSQNFRSPGYPFFPALTLLLCLIFLVAIVFFNMLLSLLFLGGAVLVFIFFFALLRNNDGLR